MASGPEFPRFWRALVPHHDPETWLGITPSTNAAPQPYAILGWIEPADEFPGGADPTSRFPPS